MAESIKFINSIMEMCDISILYALHKQLIISALLHTSSNTNLHMYKEANCICVGCAIRLSVIVFVNLHCIHNQRIKWELLKVKYSSLADGQLDNICRYVSWITVGCVVTVYCAVCFLCFAICSCLLHWNYIVIEPWKLHWYGSWLCCQSCWEFLRSDWLLFSD